MEISVRNQPCSTHGNCLGRVPHDLNRLVGAWSHSDSSFLTTTSRCHKFSPPAMPRNSHGFFSSNCSIKPESWTDFHSRHHSDSYRDQHYYEHRLFASPTRMERVYEQKPWANRRNNGSGHKRDTMRSPSPPRRRGFLGCFRRAQGNIKIASIGR